MKAVLTVATSALVILLSLAGTGWGATYYVDAAAATGGNGSLATPFKTLAAAQAAVTGNQSDNFLLFKKGCYWREEFVVGAYGTPGHPFTIGAYGTGANPLFDAGNYPTTWTNLSGTIYYTASSQYPKYVWRGTTFLKYHPGAYQTLGSNEWDYYSGNVFINIGKNPTGETIIVGARDTCINLNGHSNITIDGIKCQYSNSLIRGAIFGFDCSNIIIKNCNISNPVAAGIRANISTTGCSNWVVDNCTLTQTNENNKDYSRNSGVLANAINGLEVKNSTITGFKQGVLVNNSTSAGSSNISIHDDYFYHNGRLYPTSNLDEGAIYIAGEGGYSGPVDTGKVYNNTIANSYAYGIAFYNSANFHVYDNDVDGTYINGIVFNTTTNCWAYRNFVTNASTNGTDWGPLVFEANNNNAGFYSNLVLNNTLARRGISVNQNQSGPLVIANNTVINSGSEDSIWLNGIGTGASTTYKNNIVVNPPGTANLVDYPSTATVSASNNCYYATSPKWKKGSTTYTTLVAWYSATGMDNPAYSINADPLFYSSEDRHIRPESPCAKKGVRGAGIPTRDFDNKPYLGSMDIGAYRAMKNCVGMMAILLLSME